jgi:hypothetical protein
MAASLIKRISIGTPVRTAQSVLGIECHLNPELLGIAEALSESSFINILVNILPDQQTENKLLVGYFASRLGRHKAKLEKYLFTDHHTPPQNKTSL